MNMINILSFLIIIIPMMFSHEVTSRYFNVYNFSPTTDDIRDIFEATKDEVQELMTVNPHIDQTFDIGVWVKFSNGKVEEFATRLNTFQDYEIITSSIATEIDLFCLENNLDAQHVLAVNLKFFSIFKFILEHESHGGHARRYIHVPNSKDVDLQGVILSLKSAADSKIEEVESNEAVKFKLTQKLLMERLRDDGTLEHTDFFLNSPTRGYEPGEYDSACNFLLDGLETFIRRGSGWYLKQVMFIKLIVLKYRLLSYHKGRGFVDLPTNLKNKKAVINIQNVDNKCFLYAVLCLLHRHEVKCNKNLASSYKKWLDDVIIESFPVDTNRDIDRFHKDNPSLAVNIFKYQDDEVFIVRQPSAKMVVGRKILNLLLVENGKYHHYLPITSLNALMRQGGSGKRATHRIWCERCLRPFYEKRLFENHREVCYTDKRVREILPEPNTKHQFKNQRNRVSPSHVCYFDFECLIDENNVHKPIAGAYYVVANKNCKSKELAGRYEVFYGEDCVQQFINSLESLLREYVRWNVKNVAEPMVMSNEDKNNHENSTHCFACDELLLENKVRHHDHLSGRYVGTSCKVCNDSMRDRHRTLYCLGHNAQGYDLHLVCKYSDLSHAKISIIPNTSESYLSMTVTYAQQQDKPYHIRFVDSFQHLSASLGNLMESVDIKEHMATMKNEKISDNILYRKGVFPYEYIKSESVLHEQELPPKEDFYSTLTKSHITDEEYQVAKDAWEQFECINLKDYMLRYLKQDVMCLADVFESYRIISKADFSLDPVLYLSSPSLTWDAAFLFTRAKIDLIDDLDLMNCYEAGCRGGITSVVDHLAEANDPRFDHFDSSKPQVSLVCFDANNLYGGALSEYLPQGDFELVDEVPDIMSIDPCGPVGYYLVVSLEYTKEAIDRTKDLPLCPQHGTIDEDHLTDFMKEQWKTVQEKRGTNKKFKTSKKLLLTCYDVEEYPVHFRLLQFQLKMGLKLKKIHKAYKFRQAPFLKPYIDFHTTKRQLSTSDFQKNFHKLMVNSLYGKTVENVRKRRNFRLATNEKTMRKLVAKPEHEDVLFFSESLTGHCFVKSEVVLDKPIYIGQTVLDLSKLEMYKFYYDSILPLQEKFNCKIRFLAGDTDSLFLKIENVDYENVLLKELDAMGIMDTSNFPSDHPLFSTRNKAKLHRLKDETICDPVKEMVLLRPKLYSFKTKNGDKKRAKGVSRAVVKKEITHDDYRDVIDEQKELYRTNVTIASKLHELKTISIRKRALTFFEDKRAWVSWNESLPYGHYKLASSAPSPCKKKRVIPPDVL